MPVTAPPAAGADVAAACKALVAALPREVDPGVARRPVTPDDGRTAAWGDPAVTLVCGVPPGDAVHDEPLVVDGVAFTVHTGGGASTWTTYGRTVRAAVRIPSAYENGIELVYPLAGPVDATLPVDPSVEPLYGSNGSPAPTPAGPFTAPSGTS